MMKFPVFDFFQIGSCWKTFEHGKKQIPFAEMAKTIWDDNKFDVVIGPAGLYLYEISQMWAIQIRNSLIFIVMLKTGQDLSSKSLDFANSTVFSK